jgi:signal transduction histidine kinase
MAEAFTPEEVTLAEASEPVAVARPKETAKEAAEEAAEETAEEAAEEEAEIPSAALRHALDAVAQLAVGVSHQVNNPLASIVANLSALSEEIEATLAAVKAGDAVEVAMHRREVRQIMGDLDHGALRIRDVVDMLGELSPARDNARPVSVRAVLDTTLGLIEGEIRRRARLVRRYGDVPPVHVPRSQLGQVFLNVLLNAAQSIPAGAPADNEIRVDTRRGDDGEVIVRISDTGVGIPADIRARIFEPFFSTRAVGTGVGLGLSVAHHIVAEAGGALTVDSEVDVGSAFTISLPAYVSSKT